MPKKKLPYKLIPLEEVAERFPPLDQLAVIFNHDIVQYNDDTEGRWRWKGNKLMQIINGDGKEGCGFYTPAPRTLDDMRNRTCYMGALDLNWLGSTDDDFDFEEYMKFYMQIGYSLGGFFEIFDDSTIKKMVRKHKGKVLKL